MKSVAEHAKTLAAIGSEPRLNVLRLLLQALPEGLTVTEIQSATGIANSTLSHHLERLKREGLITSRKDRQWIWYSANPKTLLELMEFLYQDCCQGRGELAIGVANGDCG